jgi:3'5'-cyclic nucleotide phosphodiesterase
MSVAKLLSRIVAPDIDVDGDDAAANLHDYTYGITSDPLTQFACVFAALIHDSDHYGITNAQLVAEKAALAHKYKNRSPAEQNSVNIAWNILMKSQFSALRATICPTDMEMYRFRQLVVNSVMATDIADKDMKDLRDARWDKAFSETLRVDESTLTNINRKATIVIEHLIQASDVAHTMQHWHVYTKWNEFLFQEMSLAYVVGRATKDPADFWYKGELAFFDSYIIPLARKLSECGVFGVSSDEYLNYALRNREEWERRGEEILEKIKADFQAKLRNEYGHLLRMGTQQTPEIQTAQLGIDGSVNEEQDN